MDNSLKIFINYYDILKKVFFLGFVSVTLLFCILNIKTIFADENTDKTIFIAFDSYTLNDEEDFRTSREVIYQIANYYSLKDDTSVMLQSYGTTNGNPIKINKENIKISIDDYLSNVNSESDNLISNHYLAISDGFTQIAENVNVSNSEFYLISPLNINIDESSETKLNNLSELYSTSEIKLNIMALPSSLVNNRDFFSQISQKTKGYFIDFGTNKAYTYFIKLFLNDPILFVDTNLDSKPLSNFINVPPTVNKLRIGIYREDIETKVSLINPDGNELIENSDYNFWELDKIIFLDINKPQSGTWTIITNGSTGKYEIYTDTSNPLELKTFGDKIYPVNSEILLEVGAYFENSLMNISDAELQVRVRDFKGTETIQIMNDIGQKGDKVAFDGIYSAILASMSEQSVVDLEYTLQWKNLTTPVKHNDQIKIEYYPELNVTSISNAAGKVNQDFIIAKFQTSVNSYPFLVGIDEIDLITDKSKNYLEYRLDPVKIKDTHKSYEFNIIASSSTKIKEEISLQIIMNTTYLDQDHQTPSVNISVQLDTNFLYIFGLRYYYWLIIILAILILAIFMVNYFRRANIYGFMIDVENNVIVDFSEIKRNPIEKMIHPKRISFKNIKQLPYNGGYFEFFENEVYINVIFIEGDPSIRINSVPVTDRELISDGQWIGSSGKQVRFNKNIPYMKI
ncbi:MAG: hypothetical protein FI682_05370 [SAR202 cluster bacterium]|nr:hypothetical protein [SAR202 cluster bacterium]